MKRGILISITGVFILLSYIVSLIIIMQVPVVEVFTVRTREVESTVVCNGKFEYSGNQTVCSPYTGKINDIYVSEGDHVCIGDKLYSIIAVSDNISEYSNSTHSQEDIELVQRVLSGNPSALDEYSGDGIAVSKEDAIKTVDILSDYSGIVGEIYIAEKQSLADGDKVLNVSDSENMQIRLDVSEDKIAEIEPGQKVEISCNAIKDNSINGTVREIGNTAKQTSTTLGKETTVEVIVSVDSELDPEIKAGYTAKCSIVVDKKNNAILVPYEAVSYDDNGSEYVMCYSETGNCIKKTITTGKEYGDGVEVISGIEQGEILLSFSGGIEDSTFVKAEVDVDD